MSSSNDKERDKQQVKRLLEETFGYVPKSFEEFKMLLCKRLKQQEHLNVGEYSRLNSGAKRYFDRVDKICNK